MPDVPIALDRGHPMKLFSGPLSMFGAKVEIALREKGQDFELEMVPFDMQKGYQPKHPEVLCVNPKRQVPVLLAVTEAMACSKCLRFAAY
jgi:glutathione S-transferase